MDFIHEITDIAYRVDREPRSVDIFFCIDGKVYGRIELYPTDNIDGLIDQLRDATISSTSAISAGRALNGGPDAATVVTLSLHGDIKLRAGVVSGSIQFRAGPEAITLFGDGLTDIHDQLRELARC